MATDRVPDVQKEYRDLRALAEKLVPTHFEDHTTSGNPLFVAAHMLVQKEHSHVPVPRPASEGHMPLKDLRNMTLRHTHADGQ
jgi:hypothetical protein